MSSILDRLAEPSSWAGLAALATSFGVTMPPGIVQNVSLLGAGAAGLAGFFLREKGPK